MSFLTLLLRLLLYLAKFRSYTDPTARIFSASNSVTYRAARPKLIFYIKRLENLCLRNVNVCRCQIGHIVMTVQFKFYRKILLIMIWLIISIFSDSILYVFDL